MVIVTSNARFDLNLYKAEIQALGTEHTLLEFTSISDKTTPHRDGSSILD